MVLGMASLANAEAAKTKLTFWTFIDQHKAFFEARAQAWNELHPDRQIELEATVIGYEDMHNKFKIALQSGVARLTFATWSLASSPTCCWASRNWCH